MLGYLSGKEYNKFGTVATCLRFILLQTEVGRLLESITREEPAPREPHT